MKYRVVAVGRVKDAALRAACDGYLERLSHYAKVEEGEVKDEARLLGAIPSGTRLVALSRTGASWSSRDLAAQTDQQTNAGGNASDWRNWWRFSGFDHVERHDDRVQLFATRLAEGLHEFSYVVRATTAGTFRTAPARAEEMYEPEVFGRTATTMIEVKR